MDKRMKLGEMLQRANLVSDLQIKAALVEQQRWGGRLGKILVDMSYVSEDMIIKALSRQLNLPRANLDNVQVPPQVLMKLDRTFCQAHGVVPCAYSHNDRAVQVAMTDPTNLKALDEIKFKTGLRVVPALAGEKAIAMAIGKLFQQEIVTDEQSEEVRFTNSRGNTMGKGVAEGKPAEPKRVAVEAPPPLPAPVPPPPVMVSANPPVVAGPVAVVGPAGGASRTWAALNPVSPRAPAAALPGSGPPAAVNAENLALAQKRQTRAIKAMVELLIEKGVFSQEEYLQLMNRKVP